MHLLLMLPTIGLLASLPSPFAQLEGTRAAAEGEGWRVSRVSVQHAGELTVWLSDGRGEVAPLRALCRGERAERRPALAHTRRFDLRLDRPREQRRGGSVAPASKTPEALVAAAEAVAARLRTLEGGVSCAALQPTGGAPGDVDPSALAAGEDRRPTVLVERAVGWPLRDVAWVWLLLWAVAWVALLSQTRAPPEGPMAGSGVPMRLEASGLVGVLLVAAVARLVAVGEFTLNPDEHASLDARPWLEVFRGDDDSLYHPPLARLLFRGWLDLAPEHVPRSWWRLPSVIAGVLTVAGVMRLLRRVPLAALCAGLLVALSPQAIFVSDLAKPYALTSAAFVWGLVALWHARAPAPWLALTTLALVWLDYVAAAHFSATVLLSVALDRPRFPGLPNLRLSRLGGWALGLVGGLPLAPLLWTGVQFARQRAAGGAAAPGYPAAPALHPAQGLWGRPVEWLEVVVGVASPWAWLALAALIVGLAIVGFADSGRRSAAGHARGLARAGLVGAALWLALGLGVASQVYTRPQNLAFAGAAAQALGGLGLWGLAVAFMRALSRSPGARLVPEAVAARLPHALVAAALLAAVAARAPQLSALYANQRQGSVADLNFGPDCHRAVGLIAAKERAAPTKSDVLAQLDGDAHCLMVEAVPGDPHQRAFPDAGHLPGGAPCQRAVAMRWCAGGRDPAGFQGQLRAFAQGWVVVDLVQPPRRPARCKEIGRTADFGLWRCGR